MALRMFHTELGEPDLLRTRAWAMRARADAMWEAAARLHEVSTKGVWDSPSGVTFASRVDECPQMLHRLASTLSDAAQVIEPYADLLAESQRVMRIERAAYEEHVATSDALEAQLAQLSPEDPRYVSVDRQWRDAADEREFAKRRYEREGEQATLDEEAVARRLADIGADASDPWGYDLFEGLSDLGRSRAVDNVLTDFVPHLRLVALLQFGDAIGKLGLRAFYGQGSYSGAGRAARQTLFNVVKAPLGAGAKADDAARRTSRASETAAAKSRHGDPVGASGSGSKRLRHKAGTKVRQTTSGARVRAKHAVQDGFEHATGTRLINNMTSDWAAIAGAGHVTKGAHVLKYSVAAADTVDGTVRSARTTAGVLKPLAGTDTRRDRREAPERASR
ncbi:hypothetical protein [Janibacter sp. DB-40]|uniref:hypothetical protein n=1 Tax=Janibacter sp. DB-40 TaxID=3028808 RepID=UPI0024050BAE|nr:hypothetical protein [Janibacter sp. DB-40]